MKRMAVVTIHIIFLARTALRAAGIIFGLLMFVHIGRAQDVPKDKLVDYQFPLPPNLKPETLPHCQILTHTVAQTVEAKTGLPQNIVRFRVEVSATDGNKKPWTLPPETMPHSNVKRPGAIADVETMTEGAKICGRWFDYFRAAQEKILYARR